MNMQYLSSYTTKDRFEIYTLLACRCVVDGYDGDERGTVFFRFEDKEKCERLLSKLLSKKLKVYMHDAIGAIRDAQAIFNNKPRS